MANDTTIVRFVFEGAPSEVEVGAFANLATALRNTAIECLKPLGQATIDLVHALPPRRGSIEFHLKAKVEIKISNEAVSKFAKIPTDWLDRSSKYATIGAFAWAALLGGNGLLNMFLHPEKTAPATEHHDQLAVALRSAEQQPQSLQHLIEAARKSGADRVEVQLPEEPAVVIYSRQGRRDPKVIASRPPPLTSPHPRGLVQMRLAGEPIHVVWRGEAANAYLVLIDDSPHPYLAIWKSRKLPNTDGPFHAVVDMVDRAHLEALDDFPGSVDTALGLIIVTQSGDLE